MVGIVMDMLVVVMIDMVLRGARRWRCGVV